MATVAEVGGRGHKVNQPNKADNVGRKLLVGSFVTA